MKKGLSFWSFPEGTSVDEAIRRASEHGFDGLELAMDEHGEVSLDSSDEEIMAVGEKLRKANLTPYSLATILFWKYSFSDADPQIAQKALRIARRMIDFAAILGCDSILVVPGAVEEDVPYDAAYDRALAACMELKPYAEEKKIHVCLENVWNKFLLSPLEFRDFLRKLDSPYMNAYFDAGNVQQFGYPVHWINILGPRIRKVHIKDFRSSVGNIEGFVDLLSGDVNFPEVMRALRETGYDGWITAEICPAYKYCPEQLIRGISSAMDAIFKM